MKELRLLVVQAQDGDVDAFGEIVRRFQNMALGYAYSILGAFDLAEDAVQEAFIDAWGVLPSLRHPEAFPGWFKRVIFKHCDRLTRRKRVPVVPLSEIVDIPSNAPGPMENASQADMRASVLEAVRALPVPERTVTTLFYIDGYSQSDISEFLEVPVTTVNNRLHSSRKHLKERMLQMFGDELKNHTMSENFPERIKSLLDRPKPLEIQGHPVRELWELFSGCFADFEVIKLDEIMPRSSFLVKPEGMPRDVHSVDDQQILRWDMTSQLVDKWLQSSRMPCKWITAGRTFRQVEKETTTHLETFHQVEMFWVGEGIGEQNLLDAVHKSASCMVPNKELVLRDKDIQYPLMSHGRVFYFPWQVGVLCVGEGGIGDGELLKRGDLDPKRFGSVHFAFGLERCAMAKYDLDDARKLWQPPYVKK